MAREMMRSSDLCKNCLAKKYLFDTDKQEYLDKINKTIKETEAFDAGKLELKLIDIYNQYFPPKNYGEIKRRFNDLVIGLVPELIKKIESSSNPLYTVIKMSLVSNYIDYSAFRDVEESKLIELLSDVDKYDFSNYQDLINELSKAKTLLYITDNCGEVVIDKLVIEYIKKYYPNIQITAMVRGAEVVNDASMVDAKYIGLDKVCNVIDNGINSASSKISELPLDRQELMKSVDLIIAKGQANAETMTGCGLNVYYLLLCKCDFFAKIFQVEKLTPLIEKELI